MAVVSARVVEVHQPPPVGGITVPIDKFALLAPYIGLTSTTLVLAAATATYVKLKRGKENEG